MNKEFLHSKGFKIAVLVALPLLLLLALVIQNSWRRPRVLPGLGGAAMAIAFAPDGRIVCATDNRMVQIWKPDIEKWRSFIAPRMGQSAARIVRVTRDGKKLIAGGSEDWQYATAPVQVFDVATRQFLFNAGYTKGRAIALAPDDKTLAIGYDKKVLLYDLTATPKNLKDYPPQLIKPRVLGEHIMPATAIAFAPDGKSLAAFSMGVDGIREWNLQTGKTQRAFTWQFTDTAKSLAYSPDGRFLAAGSGSLVLVWDVQNGQLLGSTDKTLQPNPSAGQPYAPLMSGTGRDTAATVEFSPDGKTIVSSGNDGVVLWDAQTLHEQRRFEVRGPASISPDGGTLATGSTTSGREVLLWRLR